MITDKEIIFKELWGLVDLIKSLAFCIYESRKVVIVGQNNNTVFAALQIYVPSL